MQQTKVKHTLVGLKFNMLEVIKRSKDHIKPNGKKEPMWSCRCECGELTIATKGNLKNGLVKSCGCLRRVFASKISYSHGMAGTRFYKIWSGMKNRTTNENDARYMDYGGRGITLCERWKDFENFFNDMHESYLVHSEIHGEKNTSIDRINNNVGYNISNCKWSTCKEQAQNRRKKTRLKNTC